jgi:choline dehydrogenase-like flavoprotein
MLEANDLPDGQCFHTNICIVGAGAAGIAMALDLAGSRIKVLVLESGGLEPDAATQQLYAGSVADTSLHSPPDRYRQRCFGGSTTTWGGRCVPFDEIDFEARAYIPHSGWPFGRRELEQHYLKANELCEAGAFAYRARDALDCGSPPMIRGFNSQVFTQDTLERFSRPTDFGARYADQLRAADNVCVLLHANLAALNLDEAGMRVGSATVRTLSGKTFCVFADHFVLAAGGLEVARLLLASRDVQPHGIGNDRDQVGRHYMCHIAGTLGRLAFNHSQDVWHGYDVSRDGVYCRRRLALTAEAQRHWQVGSFVARLHHPRITDPSHRTGVLSLLYLTRGMIPYEYGKRLYDEEAAGFLSWMQHLGNVVSDPHDTAAFLLHWMRCRTFAKRKFPSVIVRPKANCYSLDFHAEQEPNPSSRITLDTETDALGMPRIRVDWRYSKGDIETVRRSIGLLSAELQRCKVGTFDYDPSTLETEMVRYGAYGGHHIGTARMGTNPQTSVVTPDCRVHGVANLFVAGAATFPTSSQANPTLTVVALSLRLAGHLKQLCAPRVITPVTSGPVVEAISKRTPVASAA